MRAFGRVASLRSTDRNVCFTGKPNPGATTLRSLVRSGGRKLETSRNHTSHRDIFVDLFPAQRSTPNLNSDLLEVFIGRIAKAVGAPAFALVPGAAAIADATLSDVDASP